MTGYDSRLHFPCDDGRCKSMGAMMPGWAKTPNNEHCCPPTYDTVRCTGSCLGEKAYYAAMQDNLLCPVCGRDIKVEWLELEDDDMVASAKTRKFRDGNATIALEDRRTNVYRNEQRPDGTTSRVTAEVS